MSNNVIHFPKENKNIKKIISLDEINHNVEMINLYHIQESVNSIVPILFTQLDIAGFGLDDETDEDESIRDGAFIVEAIRSMMCKYYGIYHPFQKLVDTVFEEDLSEKGALKIVDSLNVVLKEDEDKKD